MTSTHIHTTAIRLRRADAADHDALLALWERSVRATHHFLTDHDVRTLRPLVADELAGSAVEWWVATTPAGSIIGLLGYTPDAIEGLFLEPAFRNQGVGRQLVEFAQQLGSGELAVDVNEQNSAAVGFYTALGFVATSRSATDGCGRPFPLLHMRRIGGAAPSAVGTNENAAGIGDSDGVVIVDSTQSGRRDSNP